MRIRIALILLVTLLLSLTACKETPWVAKIDGEPISLEEFENFYYGNHTLLYNVDRAEVDKIATKQSEIKRNPYLDREEFLRQLVKQLLVSKMIDEEKLLEDDKDYLAFMELQNVTSIVSRYSQLKFKDKLEITEEEIEAEYKKNKAQYENVPATQVEQYIRQRVQYEKYQKITEQVISSILDKHKVVRNEELIDAACELDPAKWPQEGDLITIDDKEKITIQKFNDYYYAQNNAIYNTTPEKINELAVQKAAVQQNPLLNRKLFFEQLIRYKLVYDEAMNGEFKMKDNVELQYFMKIQENLLKANYYVQKKYASKLEPTPEEIDMVYQQNKAGFKDAPISEVEAYIRPRILQQKLQSKTMEVIEKAKEKSIIEYNNKTLKASEKKETKKEEDKK